MKLRLLSLLMMSCVVCSLCGCHLLLMGYKVFRGDPMIESPFTIRTKVDLIEDEKTVLVLCTTPELLGSEFSAINSDLVDHMIRRFRVQGINVVKPEEVDRWLARRGGIWQDPTEFARKFETDYIIHVDIDGLSYFEDPNKTLYRGKCNGNVYVYEVVGAEEGKAAYRVFEQGIKSEYPRHFPIPIDQTSQRAFQERYMTQLGDELSRIFYDHPAGADIY